MFFNVSVYANPECRVLSPFSAFCDSLMTVMDAVKGVFPHGTWYPFVQHYDAPVVVSRCITAAQAVGPQYTLPTQLL